MNILLFFRNSKKQSIKVKFNSTPLLAFELYFSYFVQHKSTMYNFDFFQFLYTQHIYIHGFAYYPQNFVLFFLSLICIVLYLYQIIFVLLQFHLILLLYVFLLFYILVIYNKYLFQNNLYNFLYLSNIYILLYQLFQYMVELYQSQDRCNSLVLYYI